MEKGIIQGDEGKLETKKKSKLRTEKTERLMNNGGEWYLACDV